MSDPARPTSRPDAVEILAWIALALIAGHRLEASHFHYLIFSDRELMRAALLDQAWQVEGSEMSYGTGGRVPGGFVNYLLWPVAAAGLSVQAVYRYVVALDLAGWALLGVGMRGLLSRRAIVVGLAFIQATEAAQHTLGVLWNPGLLPLFVTAMVVTAVRAAAERDGRWLIPFGVATGLAGQLHMTPYLLATFLLLAVLTTWPRKLWGLLVGVAALALTYAPWLWVQATTGYPAFAVLADQGHMVMPHEGEPWGKHLAAWWDLVALADAHAIDSTFGRDTVPTTLVRAWGSLGSVAALVGLLVGAVVAVTQRATPWGRAVRVVVAGTGAVLGWFLVGRHVPLGVANTGRYLAVALPGMTLLAGWVLDRAPRGGWRGALAAVVVGGGALIAGAEVLGPRHPLQVFSPVSILGVQERLDAAASVLPDDLSLADVAERTIVLEPDGAGAFTWYSRTGVDYLTWRLDRTTYGSGDAPCALLVAAHLVDAATIDEAWIRKHIGGDPPPLTIEAIDPMFGYWRPVRYRPAWGGCYTSFSNRYEATPDEALSRRLATPLPANGAVAVEGETSTWALWVGPGDGDFFDPPFPALLRVTASPGAVATTFVSNPLRGQAPASAEGPAATLDDVALVLTPEDGGEAVRVPLAPDLIGRHGLLAPVEASGSVPSGTYGARIEGHRLMGLPQKGWPLPPSGYDRRAWAIDLPGTVSVP